jgi:hypothetical protein
MVQEQQRQQQQQEKGGRQDDYAAAEPHEVGEGSPTEAPPTTGAFTSAMATGPP